MLLNSPTCLHPRNDFDKKVNLRDLHFWIADVTMWSDLIPQGMSCEQLRCSKWSLEEAKTLMRLVAFWGRIGSNKPSLEIHPQENPLNEYNPRAYIWNFMLRQVWIFFQGIFYRELLCSCFFFFAWKGVTCTHLYNGQGLQKTKLHTLELLL